MRRRPDTPATSSAAIAGGDRAAAPTAPDAVVGGCPTTVDAFLGGRLQVRQPQSGYRAGIDAVLLAAAVDPAPLRGAATLLDIGAGVGTVGLCAAARCPGLRVTLMEPQPALVALAAGNIDRNGLAGRVRAVAAGVGATADRITAAGLEPESFAVVVANPPYRLAGTGTDSADRLKAGSHALEVAQSLDDWVRFMARMTAPGGIAMMVHTAAALPEILAAFDRRFGGIEVRPLHPRDGLPANRLLLRARKGSRAPLTLLPGLILHEGDGHGFAPGIAAALREGAPLAAFPAS